MFCIRHSCYPAATLAALCRAASIAACCLSVLHALSMPVCMQSKSSLSRGSCLAHVPNAKCFEDSEPAYHCSHCGRPVMPSASGCSNMLPCTQCLQSGAQQTPSPRMLHTCTHCCLLFDCFGIPANVACSFHSSTHEAWHPATANLPMLHII
jgi:hypothetical protein